MNLFKYKSTGDYIDVFGFYRVGLYLKKEPSATIMLQRASNWLPLYDAFRNRDIELEADLSIVKILFEEANLMLV